MERLEITWLNRRRVRRLRQLSFGYDPTTEGVDQKPVHSNESGSRTKQTLGWKGSHYVSLKECTSQTRERWTLMTHVASDLARFPESPPLEALFKGGVRVEEILKVALTDICAGGDYGHIPWFSAAVGPKGTYRQEYSVSIHDDT